MQDASQPTKRNVIKSHLPRFILEEVGYRKSYYEVNGRPIIPQSISNMFGRTVYLGTKQVPSCLVLAKTGYPSLKDPAKLQVLLEEGFPLLGLKESGGWETITYSKRDVITINDEDSISVFTREHGGKPNRIGKSFDETNSSDPSYNESEDNYVTEIDPNLASCLLEEYKQIKVDFSDPFLVIRSKVIAEKLGNQPTVKVINYYADELRIVDKIPKQFLGEKYSGVGSCEFHKLYGTPTKMYVIKNHTFFGRKLEEMRCSQDTAAKLFSIKLLKKIEYFLDGKRNPEWKLHDWESVVEKEVSLHQQRAKRFIELLKTIDGIHTQRMLACPDEYWDWRKFDLSTLGIIDLLLEDEFLDGELTERGVTLQTNYGALKRGRKIVKLFGHLHDSEGMKAALKEHTPWVRAIFLPLIDAIFKEEDREIFANKIALLSQTRCCGRPPNIVVLRSKLDFLHTISTARAEPSRSMCALLVSACNRLMASAPDDALTGLQTAARLRVTTSACYEYSVAEGGTAQAINDVAYLCRLGKKAVIRNLYTNNVVRLVDIDKTTTGEYIFWRALEEVLATDLEELRKVQLVMIKDPGKARTVTKGHACLKIVLDVVNKLVAKFFAKAFPTSASGMEKSNHGWNVFKSFFTNDYKDIIFQPKTVHVERSFEEIYVSKTFEDAYALSTDFDTATDFIHHKIARVLGNEVMRKVGIPPVLVGIVNATCYHNRYVEFTSTGIFNNIGWQIGNNLQSVDLVTGIMMGDPLTKIVLHMTNMCTRQLANDIVNMSLQIGNKSVIDEITASFLGRRWG